MSGESIEGGFSIDIIFCKTGIRIVVVSHDVYLWGHEDWCVLQMSDNDRYVGETSGFLYHAVKRISPNVCGLWSRIVL